MNQREAKRFALWVSSMTIQAAVDGGWPFDEDWPNVKLLDADGQLTSDGDRVRVALEEVLAEMRRRG